MFDSLKYAKILEDAGLPRKHAETHIHILRDVIGEEMATKKDLEEGLSQLSHKIDAQITNLENRMIIKLGGLVAAIMTLALTANQLLLH